jgi:uncharacterized RDD family membrane protein YckC
MFCSGCGRAIPEGTAFCPQCGRSMGSPAPVVAGAPVSVAAPASYIPPTPSGPMTVAPGLAYAGFWLRFVAYIIDSLIISVAAGAIILILFFATGFAAMVRNWSENPNTDVFQGTVLLAIILVAIGMLLGVWLYYALMESSRHQATLGKMTLGLIVTDLRLQPISFGRASGRFFAKFITGLIPLWNRIHHGGLYGEKTGLARHDCQLPGDAEALELQPSYTAP